MNLTVSVHHLLRFPKGIYAFLASSEAMSRVRQNVQSLSLFQLHGQFFSSSDEEVREFSEGTEEYNLFLKALEKSTKVDVRVDPFIRGGIPRGITLLVDVLFDNTSLYRLILVYRSREGRLLKIEGESSLFV